MDPIDDLTVDEAIPTIDQLPGLSTREKDFAQKIVRLQQDNVRLRKQLDELERKASEADEFFAFLKKNREAVAQLPAWINKEHLLDPTPNESDS